MKTIKPFLMFQGGVAEEAMTFYTSLIEQSEITSIRRYEAGEAGDEGTVMQATFKLKDQEFMCIDSNVTHAFDFTPSISIYLTCDNEEEINHLFQQLGENGSILMPLDNYGFSKRFGWLNDKYGVSWQLTVPND